MTENKKRRSLSQGHVKTGTYRPKTKQAAMHTLLFRATVGVRKWRSVIDGCGSWPQRACCWIFAAHCGDTVEILQWKPESLQRKAVILSFFRTCICMLRMNDSCLLENSHTEHQASGSFLRNLEPNEHVRHLTHSTRVHDPRFNWIKGLNVIFMFVTHYTAMFKLMMQYGSFCKLMLIAMNILALLPLWTQSALVRHTCQLSVSFFGFLLVSLICHSTINEMFFILATVVIVEKIYLLPAIIVVSIPTTGSFNLQM